MDGFPKDAHNVWQGRAEPQNLSEVIAKKDIIQVDSIDFCFEKELSIIFRVKK